jgi:hypothetical protein
MFSEMKVIYYYIIYNGMEHNMYCIKCNSSIRSTSALHSGDPGLKSQPTHDYPE